MKYFVTGASGFIGKRVVRELLARPQATVYFLLRPASAGRLPALRAFWGPLARRAIAVEGDLTQPGLGIGERDMAMLTAARVRHVIHLGAVYALDADPELEMRTSIEGTRNALQVAARLGARHFHHVSSIAAAGLYEGVFREDMFEEAEGLQHPYFAAKHESERLVRSESPIPWRIYRPGIVVGDSSTGEMDKIDGPYYFFKLIQKIRRALPPWMPSVGLEGGRVNLVPVDFVARALVHIAHLEAEDGRCFHLTDPHPRRVGEILNLFARAAHAPEFAVRLNAALLNLLPQALIRGLLALTPLQRIRKALMQDLGLPDGILTFVNYPTRFDCREAQRVLEPAGIEVPALESYAWRLWDYWERHLDPDLFVDRSLRGRVAGRVVLVTGGSSGIGLATALRLAAAGAKTVIAARDPVKLDAARQEAQRRGLELAAYPADLTDPAQCASLARRIEAEQGAVAVLVNCAGRSIRRCIESSYDRPHDFERTMQLNYFGAIRVTMALLPGMAHRRVGHVINISTIGTLTYAPRFSAYVASKAALEAWSACVAAEFVDQGIDFTTIHMPLVRTPMISPTKLYDHLPALSPEQAADLVVDAVVRRPVRVATRLGVLGQFVGLVAPRLGQIVMNTSFRMFPDSAAARGVAEEDARPNADQLAFTQLLRGMHL